MVKWNLEDIYPFQETDSLVTELEDDVKEFKEYRSLLQENLSSKEFMKILKKKEVIVTKASKLGSYATLKLAENTSDKKALSHNAKISSFLTSVENDTMFFDLWFKGLDDKEAENYINNAGKYAYALKALRLYKEFTLSEKEEHIINVKDLSGSEKIVELYDIITNRYTYEWDGKELTREELSVHIRSNDRDERKKAYDLLLEQYQDEETLLNQLYQTIVRDWSDENIALRGFTESISARNISNDVSDSAITVLLEAVRENSDVFRKYFKVKSEIMKRKLDRYDIYAEAKTSEKNYTYKQAKQITLETYSEFDTEMGKIAASIFTNNHVHSDKTENKMSGAFCYTVSTDTLPFILLNHMDRQEDLFAMAHECGHGIHDSLASCQTNMTQSAPLPLAETASIFGEMLLSQRLLKAGSKDEKIGVLMRLLEGQYASITRQAYFVLFEIEAHKKIANNCSVDELNKIYYELLEEQFSGMEVPKIFEHEWKSIPHIYHTPFYCYAYAFGNLLVLALYKMYLTQGKEFIPKYKKILSYGGSKSPEEILKEIGIDITDKSFWQSGFDIIKDEIALLKETIKS